MTQKPFIIHKGQARDKTSPVVFDNPHSGRSLPDHFNYSCEHKKLMDFGDLHIEKLLADIPSLGIPVLESRIHRAVIDLNRHEFEIDPKKVRNGWSRPYKLSAYTRDGFGLIPSRLGMPHRLTSIFNKESMPDEKEICKRISKYHTPYHEALSSLIDKANKTNGVSIHVNMHSYKRHKNSKGLSDIILGNFNNRTCNKEFNQFVAAFFRNEGLSVNFNYPFKGAALVSKHARREDERYSIQIEIARDLYMNQQTLAYDPEKGERIKKILNKFAKALDEYSLSYGIKISNKDRLDKRSYKP
jgi:N-formylglutamate deformylase